ncbi:diaminopimelate epimerase [Fusobacterium pseudoperiodonticum]|uniref:histidine racemase n=1 Tax=Fusobacterium pseudoperiodonticum TaxID=2663009 RepID=UPI000C1C35C9|nr:diaminopimelate epimerase [Fusobacterium pseudoperiodonticum]ATV68524.1 diaminopimelate epimerase [Fusobacterium pseudoperiodonticum]
MKLDFIKINPAGNITILIDNFNIYDKDIAKISEELMREDNLHAEQVGFIKDNHLQMMGGEFCGNASRSFASLLAFRDKDFSKQKIYEITCSGENDILAVDVREGQTENSFLAKIKMPKFKSLEEIKIDNYKLGLVKFSGIDHFIFDTVENKEDNFEKVIDSVKNYLSNKDFSAFGIMFFEKENLSMKPYVYVKEVESGIFENSCASGTTALGYYLKKYKNLDRAKIVQPNGWLEYIIENDEIYIDGSVEIVAEGKVYIQKKG